LRPAPGATLHTVHGKLANAILVGMLIVRTCAFALNPAIEVSQYAHTAWKIRDGFAKGSILSIAQTPDGYLWLGTAFGLYRFDGVRNVLWQPPPDQQLPSTTIATLVAARDGTLWIGTWSGLVSWKNGKLTQYEELAGLHIFALTEDDEGSIWAGTSGPSDGKLCEIRNGGVRCHPEMGGVGRGVFGLHKDSKGNLWVQLETGVWRWRPGPPQFYAVPGLLNGRSQGMADGEDAKSGDGKLWFISPDGISVVDPHQIPINKIPPPVHIENVAADRKEYRENLSGDSPTNLRLPPLVRELEIDYTALSLVAPEKVLFRYKLEGWDQDWQDAGTRRQAFYSNLPPRNYTFHVKASNNSGLWNEAGASLDFSIAPAYYQTYWFRLSCFAAFVALLWAVYQMRVHHLQEQEKKFREAVETMPALAFVADPKGNRTFMNRGWLEYTGLSPEETPASGWEKTIHPDDLNRITERWRESQTTGEPLDYEARLRRGSDGVYRWFLIRVVPVRDKRGKIVKWCGAATDIEDRKRAEQLQADLTHASRVSTMGELVASISHELAQPVQITTAHAKASLRWLQRDPPEVTEARKGTEKIIEAGALASEIINRLRSLYKKSSPKRELVAINEVVGEMARMLRGEARGHGVSIRTNLEDDLPMTVADRVQLQQLLMNLMLNGIEAMKDTGGVLTVKSQLGKDGQIHISINDTGPGLPLGKVDRIFDAFFTTKPQGSGMGLAISKSIVESQGGRIWANGDGGRGATFYFTFASGSRGDEPFRGCPMIWHSADPKLRFNAKTANWRH
jgi:PAS domain S-box-containing protein